MRRRQSTDADLLLGDREAFGSFYDLLETPVLRFYVRATGRADMAADLTAETFARALIYRENYRPQAGSPQAWLFGIARNILSDALKQGRIEDTAQASLGMERLSLTDDELERIEELLSASDRATEALQALPKDQRLAVEGRVVKERDYQDLAADLDCSQSVARQRVSRGLRSIRARLLANPLAEENA